MIHQFINFVIRPPRAEYNPDQYLWESFTLAGRAYKRQDLELTNARGHTLRCSHYLPSPFPDDVSLPCVIYCHGNSGCRADANEAAVMLLPSNITVFTLDFSGSGLSDGNYVSLGWHERYDLKIVVSYLRSKKQISRIGLWGRSMGAVTCLLYGAEDPSISGMVLDSAFSSLYVLMMELVDVYKIRLPKFTVKMAVQYMRRIIEKKAKFDIMDLNCLQVAIKTFIPALFGHAKDDKFIQTHHSDIIYKSYAGLLYEIITGVHSAGTDVASSSSAPPAISTTKCVGKLLYEFAPATTAVDSVNDEADTLNSHKPSHLEEQTNGENVECCSYTSSNRESWGRCSSLGGSDEESSADCTAADSSHQKNLKVFARPLRCIQQKSSELRKEEKKKKKVLVAPKKTKSEKFEKFEALSKRLRLCILKRVKNCRHPT
ncbi:uncharacterized protein LOC103963697 isoform X3 [Pyrus x bretschneideri]|uniref:uncharacterized protein LOC103963697 isoform X3 n=1 Tax=Pyrus x bretschneideri TaxID=225117 RepID=UPI002030E420|nr:uncharacterized protein LOC103963697 isoform X3 [Pyrus x bretschneideri]